MKTAAKASERQEWQSKICVVSQPQLTDDAFGPTAIDAWLPEGAVRLAQDPGLGGGVVVVLEEVPLRAVVLQCLANRYDRVVIWKKQLR